MITFFIVFSVVVLALVCVVISFLFPKKKSKETPKEDKKEDKVKEDVSEEKKQDIPEILQEVTRGNYLFDLSEETGQTSSLEFEMKENPNIKKSDKTFKPIQLDGEMVEEPLNTKDILDSIDGEQETSSINQQIKNLSPEMKAILIAKLLNKKDDF